MKSISRSPPLAAEMEWEREPRQCSAPRPFQNLDAITQIGSRVRQRLLQIFFLKIRIIREKFTAVPVNRENLQYSPDRDPQSANTRLAAHLAGFDGYAIKRRLQRHRLHRTGSE